ncbi:MAG: PD40 domain-containing protein [Flammeovirgaceae bacterium]|nr:PD40 domain-containing protein [Flammeovirgaceae bacterium]
MAVVSATGGKPTILTASFDRDISEHAWSADNKTIYFVSETEGDIPLFSVPAKGGTVTK